MGQGEPLLNLDNVIKATRILLDPAGFALSPRRITVSTAGIVPKIAELGRAPVRPKLAVSLNASTEEARSRADAHHPQVSFERFDRSLPGLSAAALGEADV
jgi:adenine C2-methylase RlmN of 23S rRNA A2503 and tRNA A37